jgi:alkaline phosphatase
VRTFLIRLVPLLASVAAIAAGAAAPFAQGGARNVILFLADAGGIPTINAASYYGYGAPRSLYIQRMPYIALSDTSPVDAFVSDSAAGMTAIVTGEKTRNGVIAQSADAVRNVRDGRPLKTILEYAEERGLSTGIITNDAVTGATPASLYAKVSDRGMTAAIFQQLFTPRFGDGPDIVIGAGRPAITKALAAVKLDLETVGTDKGRAVLPSLDAVPADATRAVVVLDSAEFDPHRAVDRTIQALSKNPRGYFLMVEWDTHTDNVRRGLNRMIALDWLIERTAARVGPDTLILFTADHSFDLRVRGGSRTYPFLDGLEEAEALARLEKRNEVRSRSIRMENTHTGEEVLIAARGPGAERIRGYMSNTDLFAVMLGAYGWKAD